MALFAQREKATVAELIARRKYRDALDLLKEQLKLRPDDKSLRLQSADVLVMMGMIENATRVLGTVADDLAAEGFAAKAIAVLKKIQRLEPERRDIEARIVQIFKGNMPPPSPSTAGADFRSMRPEDLDHRVVAPTAAAPPAPRESAPAEFAAEFPTVQDLDIGPVAGTSEPPSPISRESAELLASLGIAPEVTAAEGPPPADLQFFEQSSRAPERAAARRVVSPLFDDFDGEEMLEFIRGLELLAFEPGDIIVTEGEPGDSLFVITTGFVKAFIRNPEGGSTQVRQLQEGDFFGEVSVLSGTPRTATITAAARCELLRLDHASLEEITRRKPGVRDVLQRFYDERVNNAADAEIRGIDPGTSATARQAGLAGDAAEEPAEPARVPADPAEARIRNLRDVAVRLTRTHRWADAVMAWQHYLAIRPADAEATNVLGVLLCRLGRWQDAAETFGESVRLSRTDSTAFYNLGLALTHLEQIPRAVEAYRHALKIQPDHDKARHNLNALYARLKREGATVS